MSTSKTTRVKCFPYWQSFKVHRTVINISLEGLFCCFAVLLFLGHLLFCCFPCYRVSHTRQSLLHNAESCVKVMRTHFPLKFLSLCSNKHAEFESGTWDDGTQGMNFNLLPSFYGNKPNMRGIEIQGCVLTKSCVV